MKKNIIFSIIASLALLFVGVSHSFAHKVEPKVKYKRVVVVRPASVAQIHYSNKPQVIRSGFVWVQGHYKWHKRSRSYVWVNDRYMKQKHGKTWINGHWKQVRGGWLYIPGFWA